LLYEVRLGSSRICPAGRRAHYPRGAGLGRGRAGTFVEALDAAEAREAGQLDASFTIIHLRGLGQRAAQRPTRLLDAPAARASERSNTTELPLRFWTSTSILDALKSGYPELVEERCAALEHGRTVLNQASRQIALKFAGRRELTSLRGADLDAIVALRRRAEELGSIAVVRGTTFSSAPGAFPSWIRCDADGARAGDRARRVGDRILVLPLSQRRGAGQTGAATLELVSRLPRTRAWAVGWY